MEKKKKTFSIYYAEDLKLEELSLETSDLK